MVQTIKLGLTENHLRMINREFKKGQSVLVRLSYAELCGSAFDISVSEEALEKINKAVNGKKGCQIHIDVQLNGSGLFSAIHKAASKVRRVAIKAYNNRDNINDLVKRGRAVVQGGVDAYGKLQSGDLTGAYKTARASANNAIHLAQDSGNLASSIAGAGMYPPVVQHGYGMYPPVVQRGYGGKKKSTSGAAPKRRAPPKKRASSSKRTVTTRTVTF